ncbi:MAG TPA: hypothetical protein VMV47_03590 [Bacteroidales bacterium]|nr:hypothetical protein [Bacteroidales bacterium]
MKTLIATSVMTALLISGVAVMAQGQNEEYLGLPGDNLNLYAVMNLFQESKTLEEFERNLNDENSRINNLDLNGDSMIDYVNVFDNVHGNVHNIVLQVAVNKREKQDVAVFTVERDKEGNVMIQLTGDEALYGENYIIEPVVDESVVSETPNPGYTGNAASVNGRNVVVVRTSVYEIATWPLITYIYSPGYVVWRSSWYWGYYPSYWRPWRPFYWHYYYGYHYNYYDHYYSYYRRWNHHRHDYWHDYYYRPNHSHSHYVAVNIKDGHYKSTYSHPEERKNGEALYSSTHRDSGTRRNESINVADQNRRSPATPTSVSNRGDNAGSSTRRSESSVTTRSRNGSNTPPRANSSSQIRKTETKSSTQSRSYGSRTSSQARPAESRTPSQVRSSVSKSPAQVRTAEPRTRQTSKASAPAKRESKPKATVKRESSSKSKETNKKKETKRR